jgi:hypothetical protein
MHYELKKKLNKVDSQQYKNLLVPEIDVALNEAQELFVKMVAQPRLKSYLGFEKSQRNIDDIRTIVVEELGWGVTNNIVTLPPKYWHYIKGTVYCTKAQCIDVPCRLVIRRHEEDFENSPFDKSSFEWRHVNGLFNENGIKLFTDNTFTINSVDLVYIRKLSYIHYADAFGTGGYKSLSGILLRGTENCELPDHTHREIVDIAALLLMGELQIPGVDQKVLKLNLNKLN